jgi:hypothetical protein
MKTDMKTNAIPSLLMRHPVAAFFVLTYAISWGIWLLMAVLSLGIHMPLGGMLNIVAIFGPTLAGLTLTATGQGRTGVYQLLSRLWQPLPRPAWIGVALLLPLVIMAVAAALAFLIGDLMLSTAACGWLAAPTRRICAHPVFRRTAWGRNRLAWLCPAPATPRP